MKRLKRKQKSYAADIPEIEQLEQELARERYKHRFYRTVLSTLCILIVVAAIAVLAANLWIPVLQVEGNSMTPTFQEGDVLVALKTDRFQTGDIVAFYYNNKILIKRVIAVSGDWVDIDSEGNVYVNDIAIDEPYLEEKALGDCNIELPYQVPESRIFVMGDHRSISVDSRSTSIGCVAEEQIVGKIFFRIWPFENIEKIEVYE